MGLRFLKFQGKNLNVTLRDEADSSVFEEIFRDLDYKELDSVIKTAGCILDLGAHIGLFSLYSAGLNNSARIFAFEPEKENFLLMKENLKQNRIKNVVMKNLAVSGTGGTRMLNLSEDSHNHRLTNFSPGDFERQEVLSGETLQTIQTITLLEIYDRILLKSGIKVCDLVKMDVEGAEFEIFESLRENGEIRTIIKNFKRFFIEYHELDGRQKDEIVRILMDFGYKVYVRNSFFDQRMGFISAEIL